MERPLCLLTEVVEWFAGKTLAHLALVPVTKPRKIAAKESLSCAAELGTRALESSLQLCDATTESAVLRLTRLFNSIGDARSHGILTACPTFPRLRLTAFLICNFVTDHSGRVTRIS